VKVLNSKGIASHAGPESCVGHREVRDEALTGEPAGQPLSREIFKLVQGADAVRVVEGNTDRRVKASVCSTLRGLRGCLKSPDSRQIVEYVVTPASGQLG
jgi:hypothetical protein